MRPSQASPPRSGSTAPACRPRGHFRIERTVRWGPSRLGGHIALSSLHRCRAGRAARFRAIRCQNPEPDPQCSAEAISQAARRRVSIDGSVVRDRVRPACVTDRLRHSHQVCSSTPSRRSVIRSPNHAAWSRAKSERIRARRSVAGVMVGDSIWAIWAICFHRSDGIGDCRSRLFSMTRNQCLSGAIGRKRPITVKVSLRGSVAPRALTTAIGGLR